MAEPWRSLGALEFAGQDGPRWIFRETGGQGRLILTLLEHGLLRVQVQPLGCATVERTWSVVGRAGETGPEGRDREDLSVFACPDPLNTALADGSFELHDRQFRLNLDLRSAALSISLPDGSPLLADHEAKAYRTSSTPGARGIRHTLRRSMSEVYMGLGEVSGPLDRHHRRYRLRPNDAMGYDAGNADPLYKHIPAYMTLTAAGHATGLLYDTGAEASFDFGREVDNYEGFYRYAEFAARELDFYVLIGPEVSTVTRRIQELTGFAKLPPRWTLAYQGSTMSYTDSDDPTAALGGFVDTLRQERLQCGGFNLSSGYSMADDGLRYVFEWNRRRVPDPVAMTRVLQEAGVHTVANVKPALLTSHPRFAGLAERGAFVGSSSGTGPYTGMFWGGQGAHLDFTNPHAYGWWREQVASQILAHGIHATWNDNNEFQISDEEARLNAGEAGDLRPTLTLLMNMSSRDAQRQVNPASRDYQLTRSGGLGMQRLAATWSGDNYTSWRTLRYNLPMGLGMSLSGWANHGHDVGGFAGPMPDAELLLRWVEAGVLQPRFCVHSWNDDRSTTEPWSHPEVLPDIRRLLNFREALIPYLYTLLHDSVWDGTPITRPFVYSFQEWQPGHGESFAYMLGDALLAAPALDPAVSSRSLLLPPGRWLELQTGLVHEGNRLVELRAEPGWPPLLLREGHALPLAAVTEPHHDEPRFRDPEAVEWLAFPDSAGAFSGRLTWDDGVSRLESRVQASQLELNFAAGRLSHKVTDAPLPAGFNGIARVLVPGGTEHVAWFRSGFSELQ